MPKLTNQQIRDKIQHAHFELEAWGDGTIEIWTKHSKHDNCIVVLLCSEKEDQWHNDFTHHVLTANDEGVHEKDDKELDYWLTMEVF